MEKKASKFPILNAISLFANVGIAETYFDEVGVNVVLANEIDPERARFYSHLYPSAEMIVGDITCQSIQDELVNKSKEKNVELLIATPPCQGMSTAGKKQEFDPRNSLISCAVDMIKRINPKFVLLENVPEQLLTRISVNGKLLLIPDFLHEQLDPEYYFADKVIVDASDYGVPQSRQRAIFLLTRKDAGFIWQMPPENESKVTMEEAIGDLPMLDPYIRDIEYDEMLKIFPEYEERKKAALKISKWHYPPNHIYRQVYSLMHTPTGQTAFNNSEEFRPKKENGDFVKGFKNTYKRQEWDKPACTVTMYNRTIGSQNNVHPGRPIGCDDNGNQLYSDARVLTVYEIMLIMSLPKNWDIPEWASENFVRSVIGEGIPPLLTQKIIEVLQNEQIKRSFAVRQCGNS